MDRAGAGRAGDGFCDDTAAERAPGAPSRLVRHAGFQGPAERGTVQAALLDCLGCSHALQLRRPVGRADDERHAGQAGLDDSRMELGGGRAARCEHDGRHPGGQADAECHVSRRALVEANPHV